jgi:hypothetical protein
MKGGRLLAVVAGFSLLLSLAGLAGAEPAVFPFDRDFFPYYPSLLKWEKSSVGFTPPKVCGECHQAQYKEWSGSVHNLAFQDPLYQGELNKAVKAVGHHITRQCEGCHSPAGMMSGETKGAGLTGLSPMALAGVSCDICHSVSGVTHWQTPTHDPENGSIILSPGKDTAKGGVLVKRGPGNKSPDCGGGFHQCEESPLHLRVELCAGCHQVYHYETHFPLEATYNEWKRSPYAQMDIICQDCHMVDTATYKKAADFYMKPTRKDYRHYFNGANYLLSYLSAGAATRAGDKELAASLMRQYDMAVERLKSAAEVEILPVYQGKELAELKVRVVNLRAGHNLPTSLANIRQMWLELTARDEKGNIILSSGTLNPDGTLTENTRTFSAEGMGKDYHLAIDPWVVTAFTRADSIPPKGYREVYYGVKLPAGIKSLAVEAKLRYRQADQKVAEALLAAVPADINLAETYGLKSVPPLPVVDMVVKKVNLAVGR